MIISIGLPVYNGEKYLHQALDSLLSQTWEDFELIISDNGSTDATRSISESYAAADSRVKYFREEINRGASWNFNRVFRLAQGKYFKWAAHDDLCAPVYLESCLLPLEDDPERVLAYPQTRVIDENGDYLQDYPDHLHLEQDQPSQRFWQYLVHYRYPRQCHPIFGLIRAEVLAKTNLLGSYISSDRVLVGELALWGKFYEVDQPLFSSRFHPGCSVRAHKAYRDLVIWFDPQKRGKLHTPRWIMLREYLRAIGQAPISPAEKRRCRLQLLSWSVWNIRGLTKDVIKAGLWPLIGPWLNRKITFPEKQHNLLGGEK